MDRDAASWPTSTMKMASGSDSMSLIPPRLLSSFSCSRRSMVASFLPRFSIWPLAISSVISARRLMDCRMVLKFVSMPPSHRWLTKGMPQRMASACIASRAERLVPTNSTLPPSEITLLTKSRSVRVHRLRLLEVDDVNSVTFAKDERGHLRVPEAGLMSEMDTRLQHLSHGHAGHYRSPVGLSLRATLTDILEQGLIRCDNARKSRVRDTQPPGYRLRVWGCLPKKAALYTMNTPSEQRLTRTLRMGRESAMHVTIKSPEDQEKMRVAGRLGSGGARHDRAPRPARREHRRARSHLPRPHRERAEGDPGQRRVPRFSENHLLVGESRGLPRHSQRQAPEERRRARTSTSP